MCFGVTIFIGREAVADTMEDLIVDTLGAIVVTTIGYIKLRKQQQKPDHPAIIGKQM